MLSVGLVDWYAGGIAWLVPGGGRRRGGASESGFLFWVRIQYVCLLCTMRHRITGWRVPLIGCPADAGCERRAVCRARERTFQ